MPIRWRLALAFAATAAVLFAIGGWLFAAALSSAQLGVIDSQLTAQLSQAARYLPGQAGVAAGTAPGEYLLQVIGPAGQVRGGQDAGDAPLLSPAELTRAGKAQLWVTRAVDGEDTRVTAAPVAGHPGWVAAAGVALEAYDATQRQVARGLAIGGAAFIETDMRAHRNPTRMAAIERATLDLVRRYNSRCPICGHPGFDITERRSGLPCAWCGTPTFVIKTEVLCCQGCGHRLERCATPSPAADP